MITISDKIVIGTIVTAYLRQDLLISPRRAEMGRGTMLLAGCGMAIWDMIAQPR